MERIFTVGELKALIAESSNEFKPKIGAGVEGENKSNNGKAYKDSKKRAKDFDGGGEERGFESKSKYEREDASRTTLGYEPEHASKEYKDRINAQAKGYTSKQEMENGIEKSGEFAKNDEIRKEIEKKETEHHENEKKLKRTGLQAREMPADTFDKDKLYEGLDSICSEEDVFLLKDTLKDTTGVRWVMSSMSTTGYIKLAPVSERQLGEFEINGMAEEGADTAGFQFDGMEGKFYCFKKGRKHTDTERQDAEAEKNSLYESNHYPTAWFKKTAFLTEGHMISIIPDEFKKEGKIFNMKDKNDNQYLCEWSDGKANVITHRDDNKLNESLSRMKELWGYKPQDTKTTGSYRLTENEDKMSDTIRMMRSIS